METIGEYEWHCEGREEQRCDNRSNGSVPFNPWKNVIKWFKRKKKKKSKLKDKAISVMASWRIYLNEQYLQEQLAIFKHSVFISVPPWHVWKPIYTHIYTPSWARSVCLSEDSSYWEQDTWVKKKKIIKDHHDFTAGSL